MTPLKQEWDKAKGKLIRICKICDKSFAPAKWNQIICFDLFCKQGSFMKAHYEASVRRWEAWKAEAKKKGYKV